MGHFTPDSEGRNGFQLIRYGPCLQGRKALRHYVITTEGKGSNA